LYNFAKQLYEEYLNNLENTDLQFWSQRFQTLVTHCSTRHASFCSWGRQALSETLKSTEIRICGVLDIYWVNITGFQTNQE